MGLSANLICFKDYLAKKIAPGSNEPPASIKAKDLDQNFQALQVIALDQDAKMMYPVVTLDGQQLNLTQVYINVPSAVSDTGNITTYQQYCVVGYFVKSISA
jgi:hypothetical protein